MDSITRTSQSALIAYYNVLRRMGKITRQDKYRLLVLWFYNHLKNESDFLWKWADESGKFVIDKELENLVERKFRQNLQCLLQSSCFIKYHSDDNCEPVSGDTWIPADALHLMVTNATPTNVNGSWPLDEALALLELLSNQFPDTTFMVDGLQDENNGNGNFMTSN